jgi:hypothetical protein
MCGGLILFIKILIFLELKDGMMKLKNVNFSAHKAFFGPVIAKLFQIEGKSTIL